EHHGKTADAADGEANGGQEAEHADAARKDEAEDDRRDTDDADGDRDLRGSALQVRVEPLPLAPSRSPDRAAALVDAAHDVGSVIDRAIDLLARLRRPLEAVVRALEDPAEFVGVHLLSIGISGDAVPS